MVSVSSISDVIHRLLMESGSIENTRIF